MGTVRHTVNKSKSANHFRASIRRTKAPNVRSAPQRGGWRL